MYSSARAEVRAFGAIERLKEAVNKRRQSGAFREHENQTQGEKQDNDRGEPPFFAEAEEVPEFLQDGKLSFHLKLLFVVECRRTGGASLPISGVVGFESQVDRLFSDQAL
jgi:hypothetical protein